MEETNKNGIPLVQIVAAFMYQQKLYSYGFKSIFGFGNRMRDYLLEGHRMIPMDLKGKNSDGAVKWDA